VPDQEIVFTRTKEGDRFVLEMVMPISFWNTNLRGTNIMENVSQYTGFGEVGTQRVQENFVNLFKEEELETALLLEQDIVAAIKKSLGDADTESNDHAYRAMDDRWEGTFSLLIPEPAQLV